MPRVNFHVHSSYSDGVLDPDALADYLAARGVSYAALTDHDSAEGSQRFREALARRGLGCVDGVEITTSSLLGETHILAYWAGARRPPWSGAGSRQGKGFAGAKSRAVPLDAREAIRLVRAQGGSPFLAHPYALTRDPELLGRLLDELVPAGLDGIEAWYAPYTRDEQEVLAAIASARDLATSAGTDLHEPGSPGQEAWVEIEDGEWRAFRDLLLRRADSAVTANPESPSPSPGPRPRTSARRFAARIVLPALAAASLFFAALFAVIIPQFGSMLLDRKKDMIKEITESAASVLLEYANGVPAGGFGLEPAQREAAARIRDIRYGREGKDYLWITDMAPRMIMHPYRPELEGMDLSEYKDENGLRVFVEFVNAARAKDEGYVEYLWQWKDDASRIVPKLSYVLRFKPWDWVIGTGVYLEDVNAEIAALTRSLVLVSAAIATSLAFLLGFIVQQSLSIERARVSAEYAVHESRERYRALAEASSEGTVLVIGGACVFANSSFLAMTGYSAAELPLLSPSDVLRPIDEGDEPIRRFAARLEARLMAENIDEGKEAHVPAPFECSLLTKKGGCLDVLVTATRLDVAGKEGYVLAARETESFSIAKGLPLSADPGAGGESGASGVGAFKARWGRPGGFLELDATASRIFGIEESSERPALFALFADRRDGEALFDELGSAGYALGTELRLVRPALGARDLRLTAILIRDEGGNPIRIDGFVQDITAEVRERRMREEGQALSESASLYLRAPALGFASTYLTCDAHDSLKAAAEKMRREGRGETLVSDSRGAIIGILTGRDLGYRAVAAGVEPSQPVYSCMTAPLVFIPEEASVGEAMEAMDAAQVGRIALRRSDGAFTGLIRRADLLALRYDTFAAIEGMTARAESLAELRECRERLVEGLDSLLAAGARARLVARLFSAAHDSLAERLIRFAIRDLGEAPCPFCFAVLGSAGRKEQLPSSDQDNAIVYNPLAGDGSGERPYFLALGERVCRDLDRIGFPLCRGGMMAMNEPCCAALDTWKEKFRRWLSEPEPERLLDIHIFFDMRASWGDTVLVEELRSAVFRTIDEKPSFLVHLAASARELRITAPPVAGSAWAKEAGALFPTLVRVFALKHRIRRTGTFERLESLADSGAFSIEAARDYAESYEDLLSLRLSLWSEGRREKGARHAAFSKRSERRGDLLVKAALAKASVLQKRIGYDFLGTAL